MLLRYNVLHYKIYQFITLLVWDYVSHVMIHYIGLEILKTDNSSLPARRLIISWNKSMSFGLG